MNKRLKKAYEIHKALYGLPKSHHEWANRFNIVHKIRLVLENGHRNT